MQGKILKQSLRTNTLICFILCLTPAFSGCADFRPGWISEQSYRVDGEDFGGHFEGEEWIPNNPDIALTYKIPDIGSGFIFDANSVDISPSIQIELLEFNTHVPYVTFLKVDAGVAYQRTYLYVGKLWTSIFEISTGVFVGWNFDDNQLSYGIGATIIKF